jgi:hypothetical protein
MSSPTPVFTTPPTLMFVGSDPGLADVCARAMPAVSLLRVGHAAGAVQRMVVTRPLVVVFDPSVSEAHAADIVECARDIRAGVVRASAETLGQLAEAVSAAALEAEKLRAIDPLPPLPPEED